MTPSPPPGARSTNMAAPFSPTLSVSEKPTWPLCLRSSFRDAPLSSRRQLCSMKTILARGRMSFAISKSGRLAINRAGSSKNSSVKASRTTKTSSSTVNCARSFESGGEDIARLKDEHNPLFVMGEWCSRPSFYWSDVMFNSVPQNTCFNAIVVCISPGRFGSSNLSV